MEASEVKDIIIDSAFAVRNSFRPGYLESVYKKALMVELKLRGLEVKEEAPFSVKYKGVNVGDFFADLVVEDSVIVELKAIKNLLPCHSAQLVNYLHSTGIGLGVLLNFGRDSKLEFFIRTRIYDPNLRHYKIEENDELT